MCSFYCLSLQCKSSFFSIFMLSFAINYNSYMTRLFHKILPILKCVCLQITNWTHKTAENILKNFRILCIIFFYSVLKYLTTVFSLLCVAYKFLGSTYTYRFNWHLNGLKMLAVTKYSVFIAFLSQKLEIKTLTTDNKPPYLYTKFRNNQSSYTHTVFVHFQLFRLFYMF
jgi:hypothetical protein